MGTLVSTRASLAETLGRVRGGLRVGVTDS